MTTSYGFGPTSPLDDEDGMYPPRRYFSETPYPDSRGPRRAGVDSMGGFSPANNVNPSSYYNQQTLPQQPVQYFYRPIDTYRNEYMKATGGPYVNLPDYTQGMNSQADSMAQAHLHQQQQHQRNSPPHNGGNSTAPQINTRLETPPPPEEERPVSASGSTKTKRSNPAFFFSTRARSNDDDLVQNILRQGSARPSTARQRQTYNYNETGGGANSVDLRGRIEELPDAQMRGGTSARSVMSPVGPLDDGLVPMNANEIPLSQERPGMERQPSNWRRWFGINRNDAPAAPVDSAQMRSPSMVNQPPPENMEIPMPDATNRYAAENYYTPLGRMSVEQWMRAFVAFVSPYPLLSWMAAPLLAVERSGLLFLRLPVLIIEGFLLLYIIYFLCQALEMFFAIVKLVCSPAVYVVSMMFAPRQQYYYPPQPGAPAY